MSVAHRSPGRYLDPMEMSADYSSRAEAATGRDVRTTEDSTSARPAVRRTTEAAVSSQLCRYGEERS